MPNHRVTGTITYTWDAVIDLDNPEGFSLDDLFARNALTNNHTFSRYLRSDAQDGDTIYINESGNAGIVVTLDSVEQGEWGDDD
jgi:hypothetical protein